MDALSLITGGLTSDSIVYVEKEPIILFGRLHTMNIKHYVGEVGKTIIVNCGEDISGSSVAHIKIKKSDDSVTTWKGEVYTMGGKANYIRYISVGSDVVGEIVDDAIDSSLVVAHYPVTTAGNIDLYYEDEVVDTLIPSDPVDGVVTFSGESTHTASLNLETGVLSIVSGGRGVDFSSAKFGYIFSGDFNLPGKYEIQAYIERGDFKGYGVTDYLVISELFD
jgi:hypothetical protein